MKKVLLALIMVLVLSVPVLASEWVEFGEGIYVDIGSMKRTGEGVWTGWYKMPDGKGGYFLTKGAFHVRQEKVFYFSTTHYDRSGKVLGSAIINQWDYVPPDTRIWLVYSVFEYAEKVYIEKLGVADPRYKAEVEQ